VIGAWVLAAVVMAPFAAKLPDETSQAFLLAGGSQSVQVSRILKERFPGGDLQPTLLVYRRAGGLTPADRLRILADARRAAHVPFAYAVLPPQRSGLLSEKGDVAATIVALAPTGVYRVTPSIDALRKIATSNGALEAHVTGTSAFSSDFDTAVKSADSTLLIATGLLVLCLLLAVYRSLKLALLPLANVAVAFVVASGVVDLLARGGLTVDSTSTSLLPVLMFGAGTDYCLLLVARYRSSLRTSPERRAALVEAMPLAAPAMIASALTVTGALILMLAGVSGIYRALGPVNAIGIVIVLTASLTLLPSLLAVTGPPRTWRKDAEKSDEDEHPRWARIGRRIRARSGLYLGGVVTALVVCALGLGLYHANADILHVFRTQTDATRGAAALLTAFPPGAVGPSTVLVERTDGALRPSDVGLVSQRIRQVAGVAEVTPVNRRSTDGRAATFSLVFADDPYGTAALDRMRLVRTRLASLPPGLRALTGDGTAARVDLEDAASRDLKVVAPLVLALVFVTLIVLLRALVMPIFLIATVILSFLATCGLVLVLFRYGFDQHAFDPVLPLIVFIFLVALGSDYNIFLMSRVREEAAAHGTSEGMLRGLTATGPVITSAGLILAGTFCVLAVLPVYDLLEIGIAVGVGVLLDTFVVRTVLVPAGTWLMGDASWWPARVSGPMIRDRPDELALDVVP
jgi:RND superfamily putative drug exporter